MTRDGAPKRRRRTVADLPVQLDRLIAPPVRALGEAIVANGEVGQLLTASVALRHHMRTMDPDGAKWAEATAIILEAAELGAQILMADEAVTSYRWRHDRVAVRLLWLIEYRAAGTGENPWPLRDVPAFWPEQRAREVEVNGLRVLDFTDVPVADLEAEQRRLVPYVKWRREQETGQAARWQGRSQGDGRMSPAEWCARLEDGLAFCDELSQRRLADFMHLSRTTLKSYLEHPSYGPRWETLQDCFGSNTLAECEKRGWKRPR
jgi:hypothetical protein